jgi:nucleotidyltransferase substrate binding protein (TIGR01987 family)
MNKKRIRWQQRFQNFEKAYLLLERTLKIDSPSEAERGGIIQFYEITFELSWKLMKDFLESIGIDSQGPRGVIKNAFTENIITDGHAWIEALDDRNLTVHTYDEAIAKEVELKIRKEYFPLLEKLYQWMNQNPVTDLD